ncbi:GntR family transcriptional repressor for pyruvate dehydrogenase complex [Evansella vedderi]|uniref:GntR family transcriptional repressor for pyruvate dehydrogenase complex n=1 Tax=Evansella vedderi TaxID=38282 RepID=A0ABU0A3X8_9BACI|nr:FadR/GntR family transcriptional regulator [Evansella vedderi]MDQ0257681.1 GntR family transcriptional repressor for pyruvate dehydrogenase complex [Evansella vedderi]
MKSKKIYEIIAEQLTEMIKNGEYKPGDRLSSVQQLAEDFNVGRSAVREALSALKAMGLIEIRQGEGTFVKKTEIDLTKTMIPLVMLQEDLLDLYEVRKLNETGAASLAALNRTEEDLAVMEEILNEMKQAEGNGELGEKADIDFHMAVVKATKNKMLYRLMETISETIKESMKEARYYLIYSDDRKMNELYNEHLEIFGAIKNKNSKEAYKKMMTHIVGVEQKLFDK